MKGIQFTFSDISTIYEGLISAVVVYVYTDLVNWVMNYLNSKQEQKQPQEQHEEEEQEQPQEQEQEQQEQQEEEEQEEGTSSARPQMWYADLELQPPWRQSKEDRTRNV
jgi:uncharacterized membrane protein YhiD involved in acid resistance